MSWQASQYAREVLEEDTELRASTRLVFMLVAERIPRSEPFATWGGRWLARASRLAPSSVRRALYELDDAGYVSVVQHHGRALEVRFPNPEVRAPVRALNDDHARTGARHPRNGARNPAHRCAPYQSDTGLDTARSSPLFANSDHPLDCPRCDGTGYVQIDDRTSTPCPGAGAPSSEGRIA